MYLEETDRDKGTRYIIVIVAARERREEINRGHRDRGGPETPALNRPGNAILTFVWHLPIILSIYNPVLTRRGIFMRCGRERARGQEPG